MTKDVLQELTSSSAGKHQPVAHPTRWVALVALAALIALIALIALVGVAMWPEANSNESMPAASVANEANMADVIEPDMALRAMVFDHNRDLSVKPATPQSVRIVNGRLQWDMPPGPRYLFQITRNALTGRGGDQWGQLSVTTGDPELAYDALPDGRVRFSIPVGQFGPGDRFNVEAIHPYEIVDVPAAARFSASSRFATISNPGTGATIGDFLSSFESGNTPPGRWIGIRDDWSPTPQFSDQFDSPAPMKLADRPDPGWYFARSDGDSDITLAASRDQTQTDDRALLNDGKLEMSAGIADGAYSYIGSADNAGVGYLIDPTNSVFIEASVRLDQMTPADNAWWAFWLMTPGNSPCDAAGNPTPSGFNAYDGHARTGTEIDIFEFVPDLGNGFNQGLFRYVNLPSTSNCTPPLEAKLAPHGRSFTYEGHEAIPGVAMPNYMDGNYHRLGMFYAPDCYAFSIDDQLIWKVTEADNPGWITPSAKESIRLSWEIQNPRIVDDRLIPNPWTTRGGNFGQTALDRDPTVFIDFVNVWEKKEPTSGLCRDGDDPGRQRDRTPQSDRILTAPTQVRAVPVDEGIRVTWQAGERSDADGYDIRRNGEGYWSVTETEFLDRQVTPGETYVYEVNPWIDGDGDNDPDLRRYGPRSASATAVAPADVGAGPTN